jgi:hypothetical protein
MKHGSMLLASALTLATTVGMAAEPEKAPADAWPMARGCPAGTGRSQLPLALPLAEHWHRSFDKTAFGAVPVIAAGTVYVGDLDGTFHALDLETGETRWSFTAEAAGFPSAAAVSLDERVPLVVVGDDTGVVRAFDRAKGTVEWEYETDGEISGGPTIVAAERDGDEPRGARGRVRDGRLGGRHGEVRRAVEHGARGRARVRGVGGRLALRHTQQRRPPGGATLNGPARVATHAPSGPGSPSPDQGMTQSAHSSHFQ